MPYPVYSTRFVAAVGAGATTVYVVPAGHRAVVKSVSATNLATTGANVFVFIGSCTYMSAALPGQYQSTALAMHQVAYAGEQVGVQTLGVRIDCMISGYLLRDDGQASSDLLPPYDEIVVETPWPLPSSD